MSNKGIDPKLYDEFKTTLSVGGADRQDWYLNTEELLKLLAEIKTIDTLIYLLIGFAGGGRFKANLAIRADDINEQEGAIKVFETKVGKPVLKYYMPEQMQLIQRYIREYGKEDKPLKGRLFKNKSDIYYQRLKDAGFRAGLWNWVYDISEYEGKNKTRLGKEGRYQEYKSGKWYYLTTGKVTSTHILKHTFVSLSSLHGVPMEAIAHMTGSTLNILEKWYLGSKDRIAQQHYQGKRTFVPWDEWITKTIHPAFIKKYEELVKGPEIPELEQIEKEILP